MENSPPHIVVLSVIGPIKETPLLSLTKAKKTFFFLLLVYNPSHQFYFTEKEGKVIVILFLCSFLSNAKETL